MTRMKGNIWVLSLTVVVTAAYAGESKFHYDIERPGQKTILITRMLRAVWHECWMRVADYLLSGLVSLQWASRRKRPKLRANVLIPQ